jgi:hypothetical protein
MSGVGVLRTPFSTSFLRSGFKIFEKGITKTPKKITLVSEVGADLAILYKFSTS